MKTEKHSYEQFYFFFIDYIYKNFFPLLICIRRAAGNHPREIISLTNRNPKRIALRLWCTKTQYYQPQKHVIPASTEKAVKRMFSDFRQCSDEHYQTKRFFLQTRYEQQGCTVCFQLN